MEKLTNEQIQAKADELSASLKVAVTPIVFIDGDEQIVGYVQEPNRMTKLRMLDKAMQSPVTAAAELLDIILLRDQSDPRIYSEKPEHDKIYMGAVMACYNTVNISVNQFNKKK